MCVGLPAGRPRPRCPCKTRKNRKRTGITGRGQELYIESPNAEVRRGSVRSRSVRSQSQVLYSTFYTSTHLLHFWYSCSTCLLALATMETPQMTPEQQQKKIEELEKTNEEQQKDDRSTAAEGLFCNTGNVNLSV